jgi:hypothetical protein
MADTVAYIAAIEDAIRLDSSSALTFRPRCVHPGEQAPRAQSADIRKTAMPAGTSFQPEISNAFARLKQFN